MKSKVLKKMVAITLVICMCVAMTTVAMVSVGAAEVPTYIYDVMVASGSSKAEAQNKVFENGYILVDHDLNSGAGGSYIYLGYKTTTNPKEAITGLALYNKGKVSENNYNYTFNGISYNIESCKTDLNKDAKGDYIYLYFTKDLATGERITSLDVAAKSAKHNMWGKDGYKTVVSMKDNLPLDVNYGTYNGDTIYIVYQSEDTELYSKKGDNEPQKTVDSLNGITYYDCEHITNSKDFYRYALSAEHNNVSQVELWADVFYSMLKAKGNGWGYRINGGFEDKLAKGKYVDMVAALSNGTGNYNTDKDIWIKSSGLRTTDDVNQVYNDIRHIFDDGPYSEISGSYVIDSELGGTDKFLQESSSEIVYTLCSFADDDALTGHEQTQTVMGMMFYNFEFVPIVGDSQDNVTLNYSTVSEPINQPVMTYEYSTNYQYDTTKGSISFDKTVTESVTNSLENTSSNTNSFTQGISGSIKVGKQSWPVGVEIGVQFGFGESFTNSSSVGYSNSKSESTNHSYTHDFGVPPYSIAAVEQSVTNIERTQQYDCPMALTYDVAFISFGAEMGKENVFYTSCAYETYYYATFGDENTTAVDALNNFKNGTTNSGGFSVMCHCEDGDFNSYSQSEINDIVNTSIESSEYNNNCSYAINSIKSLQPMSYNGGQIKYTGQSVTYTDEVYSLLPIQKIKIFRYETAEDDNLVKSISIDDNKTHSINEYYDSIKAYTCMNTEFTGWDASHGCWVLVTESGEQLPIGKSAISDGVISIKADSKTGEVFITPISNGTSYVKYIIDEDAFVYYNLDKNNNGNIEENEKIKNGTFDTKDLVYSKNSDITDTYSNGVLKIDISNEEKDNEKDNEKEELTYSIRNYNDLCTVASNVNSGKEIYTNANFVVTNDIVCPEGENWTVPIGTEENPFSGTFDGQGHTIGTLNSDSTEYNEFGLFGAISGAEIKNVNLSVDFDLKGSDELIVGGLFGIAYNYYVGIENGDYPSTITNCTVSGNMNLGSAEYAGGICGYIGSKSTVEKCINNSNICGEDIYDLGGIAALNRGLINNCANLGELSADDGYWAGGIAAGDASSSNKITNCYNIGNITGSFSKIAPICTNENQVDNCYFLDTISTGSYKSIRKTKEQFASGEVAHLLSKGVEDGTQLWYQNIDFSEPYDKYPVLTSDTANTVYKVESGDKMYSNTLTHPSTLKTENLRTYLRALEKNCGVRFVYGYGNVEGNTITAYVNSQTSSLGIPKCQGIDGKDGKIQLTPGKYPEYNVPSSQLLAEGKKEEPVYTDANGCIFINVEDKITNAKEGDVLQSVEVQYTQDGLDTSTYILNVVYTTRTLG